MKNISIYSVKQVKDKDVEYKIGDVKVTNPDTVNDFIKTVLDIHNEAVEKFGILTLNTKNKIVGIHIISIGSLNASIVHPREVFKAAILNNANSIILFHNHPSGNPRESDEDITITNRLVEAGSILGIKVLDHIIVGEDNDYVSFKQKGLI